MTIEGQFVDQHVSLEGGALQDHGVEEEYAMVAMGALDGLVDVVLNCPRDKSHAAINGKVDWDQDKGVESCFIASGEVTGEGYGSN